MRHIRALLVAVAIAGCTVESDDDIAATWRHGDGTPVGGIEIAQARTACVRAGTRELSPAETDFARDPAFHPGGVGLEDDRRATGLSSPLWRSIGRQPIPLADCLAAQGYVRGR